MSHGSTGPAFGSGGPAFACWNIDGNTVAPFGGGAAFACTVAPETKIFVAAFSDECSTFEGNGTTEDQLRACAEAGNATTASVTVDGQSVPLTEAETELMNIVLPANNLFGLKPGTAGLSVGAGWVAHLNPLTPGTHTIAGSVKLPKGKPVSFTTTIIVQSS